MKDFPITIRFPVHWSEMDAYGHVNNARYFSWFETARIAYLFKVGLVNEKGTTSDVGPIIASTTADYLKPVVFPSNLVVGARVSRIGNTSFTMEYAVEDEAGTPHARGSAVVVTLRYSTHEKLPVPESVRSAIEQLEGKTFR
jgi:acyl-CoA thioester hydrolase